MDEWEQGDVVADGIKVHYYRTGGAGPPLVLAHGLTDNGLCWSRLARVLESDFDVVMVDARNHGRSGSGPAGLPRLADDLGAVIKALGFERAAVMGHSVGAATVACLAARHPRLVSRIILEDPPWRATGDPAGESGSRRAVSGFKAFVASLADQSEAQIIEEGKKQNPRWHDDEFPAWGASKRQVRPDALDQLDLGDWTDFVPHIQCPALLIHTDNDGIVTREVAARTVAMNAHVRTQFISDAGHNVRREQFLPFTRMVSDFLATPA